MKTSLKIFLTIVGFIVLILVGCSIYFIYNGISQEAKNNTATSRSLTNTTVPANVPVVEKSNEPQPLYLTTMTHLEENWTEAATNEKYFSKIAGEIRYGAKLAEQYGAVLTFESGLPFTQGSEKFHDNVLLEVAMSGQGVGTHIDIPAKKKMTEKQATDFTKERFDAVTALVGENNFGCSGLGGASDWYTAALSSGCKYINGLVGYHYLSMSLENRPDGWTDQAIADKYYHYPAPVGDDRFYPFWVDSSKDFVEDVDGKLLVSSGETPSLAAFAETGNRDGEPPACGLDCPLTVDDIMAFVNDVKDFAASRDTTKIAKYNVYFPANLFVAGNEAVLEKFFSEAKKLQDEGLLQWASQKEVYEAKVAERVGE